MRQWATRKKCKFVYLNIIIIDNNLLTVEPRAVDPHCFDADPDPGGGGGGGGRSAKNVHPLWQNPRYGPG